MSSLKNTSSLKKKLKKLYYDILSDSRRQEIRKMLEDRLASSATQGEDEAFVSMLEFNSKEIDYIRTWLESHGLETDLDEDDLCISGWAE